MKKRQVSFRGGVPVCSIQRLWEEYPDDVVVLISDSHRYWEAKDLLEAHGFKENVHFFNGWKLNFEFYQTIFGAGHWEVFEQAHKDIMQQRHHVWLRRARLLSELLPKDIGSIMDVGCGEGLLRSFLPKSVAYYGVDYCQRNADTIICDINREQLPAIRVDAYVLAGVLMYVKDKESLIRQMKNAKYIVVAHWAYEWFLRLDARVDLDFSDMGVAPFSNADLINLMAEFGFYCKRVSWPWKEMNEYHYLFARM